MSLNEEIDQALKTHLGMQAATYNELIRHLEPEERELLDTVTARGPTIMVSGPLDSLFLRRLADLASGLGFTVVRP